MTEGGGGKADPGRGSGPAASRPPKRRHLPSLGSFATFEVAAKHLSFTLAAQELNVTQAAVSQQIRGLETALDCRLFQRKRNRMELTAEGRLLLEAATRGLDMFADAIVRIGRTVDRRSITVSATHAATTHFLHALADAHRAEHPEIRFTLLASDENDALQDFDEVDLAFICGADRAEVGRTLIPLFPEVVDPVCAPAWLAAHGPVAAPADLARADLMELHRMHWSSDAISWRPLSWGDWFRLHAPEAEEPPPGFVTNSYAALVDAAVAGQGVILGWRHLVRRELAEGRLVRLLDHPLNTGRVYYLKINDAARDNPHVDAFVARLRAEVAADPALSF